MRSATLDQKLDQVTRSRHEAAVSAAECFPKGAGDHIDALGAAADEAQVFVGSASGITENTRPMRIIDDECRRVCVTKLFECPPGLRYRLPC